MIDLYLEALSVELAQLGRPAEVATLFVGGGTPTYLDCRQLERLLTTLKRWLAPTPDCEITIEGNPGTLNADKIAVLADHRVTRVSLGAQSFHPHLLRVLERDHAPQDVYRAVEQIKSRIPQVCLDLIFGVPGQSLGEWETDLDKALSLSPDHLSTYGLTYEKGTRLWKQKQGGEIRPVDEDSELAMYAHGIDRLSGAGFEHYEISNFARPGKRSRHNQVYWANHAYFGFGMGAARYIDGRRELNTRDLRGYIRKILAGEPATIQSEQLPAEERARETIAVQLRRSDGINREDFCRQTGMELDSLVGPVLARHIGLGLVETDAVNVRLTRQGKFVADTVVQQYLV